MEGIDIDQSTLGGIEGSCDEVRTHPKSLYKRRLTSDGEVDFIGERVFLEQGQQVEHWDRRSRVQLSERRL